MQRFIVIVLSFTPAVACILPSVLRNQDSVRPQMVEPLHGSSVLVRLLHGKTWQYLSLIKYKKPSLDIYLISYVHLQIPGPPRYLNRTNTEDLPMQRCRGSTCWPPQESQFTKHLERYNRS